MIGHLEWQTYGSFIVKLESNSVDVVSYAQLGTSEQPGPVIKAMCPKPEWLSAQISVNKKYDDLSLAPAFPLRPGNARPDRYS